MSASGYLTPPGDWLNNMSILWYGRPNGTTITFLWRKTYTAIPIALGDVILCGEEKNESIDPKKDVCVTSFAFLFGRSLAPGGFKSPCQLYICVHMEEIFYNCWTLNVISRKSMIWLIQYIYLQLLFLLHFFLATQHQNNRKNGRTLLVTTLFLKLLICLWLLMCVLTPSPHSRTNPQRQYCRDLIWMLSSNTLKPILCLFAHLRCIQGCDVIQYMW